MHTALTAVLAFMGMFAQQNYLAVSFDQYRMGHFQESIDAARTFLKTNPDSAAAYNNIGISYLGLHKFDEAIENVERAIKLDKDFALAKNNLAWIREEQAKTPEAYLTQSLVDYQSGKFDQCIGSAKEAARLRPAYSEAFNNMGACSAAQGKWEDAIRYAQEALRLKPDNQLAKNNLAWATQQRLLESHKK